MPLNTLPYFKSKLTDDYNNKKSTIDFDALDAKVKANPAAVLPSRPAEEQGFAGDMVDKFQQGMYNTAGATLTGARGIFTGDKERWDLEQDMYQGGDDQNQTLSQAQLDADRKMGIDPEDEITARGVAGLVSNAAGSLLPSIIPGGIAGKVLQLAGRAIGATGKAAQTAAGVAGYGAGGALQIGGAVKDEVEQELSKMSPGSLDKLEGYKAYIDKFNTPEEALAQYKQDKSQEGLGYGSALGALFMGAIGPMMEKIILGQFGKGAIKNILGGATLEGVQEAVEEGGQGRIANPLVGKEDWEGVPERAVLGAIGGIGAGGIAGAGGQLLARDPRDKPVVDDEGNVTGYIGQDGVQYGAINTGDPNAPSSPIGGNTGTPLNIDNTGLPAAPPSTVANPTENKIVEDTGALSDALNAGVEDLDVNKLGPVQEEGKAEDKSEPEPKTQKRIEWETNNLEQTPNGVDTTEQSQGNIQNEGEETTKGTINRATEETKGKEVDENLWKMHLSKTGSIEEKRERLNKAMDTLEKVESQSDLGLAGLSKPELQEIHNTLVGDKGGSTNKEGLVKKLRKHVEQINIRKHETKGDLINGKSQRDTVLNNFGWKIGEANKRGWTDLETRMVNAGERLNGENRTQADIDEVKALDKEFMARRKKETETTFNEGIEAGRVKEEERLKTRDKNWAEANDMFEGLTEEQAVNKAIEEGLIDPSYVDKLTKGSGETLSNGKPLRPVNVIGDLQAFARMKADDPDNYKPTKPNPKIKTNEKGLVETDHDQETRRINRYKELTNNIKSLTDKELKAESDKVESSSKILGDRRSKEEINYHRAIIKEGYERSGELQISYDGETDPFDDVESKPYQETDTVDNALPPLTRGDIEEDVAIEVITREEGDRRIAALPESPSMVKGLNNSDFDTLLDQWDGGNGVELEPSDDLTIVESGDVAPGSKRVSTNQGQWWADKNPSLRMKDVDSLKKKIKAVRKGKKLANVRGSDSIYTMGEQRVIGALDDFIKGQELELTGQTEAERKADDDKIKSDDKAKKEAADKIKADDQVDDFTLTGSNNEADIAVSKGQENLLDEMVDSFTPTGGLDKIIEDLRNDKITIHEFIKKSKLDDDFLIMSNPFDKNDPNVKAENDVPYYQLIKDIQKAISNKINNTEVNGKTYTARNKKLKIISDLKYALGTLDIIKRDVMHPFNNNLIDKLPPFIKRKFEKRADNVGYGDNVKSEKRKVAYKYKREQYIEEALKLENKPESNGGEKLVTDFLDGKTDKAPSIEEFETAEKSNYGKSNKVFTESAADAARAIIKKKLNRLNAGIDPEIIQAGLTLAGYHIEAGARKFSDYSKAMIDDLGNGIEPYLKSFYESVRYYPGFDNTGMSTPEEIANGNENKIDAFYNDILSGTAPRNLTQFKKWMFNHDMDSKNSIEIKKAQEYFEAAQVRYARDIVGSGKSREKVYNELVELYKEQPLLHAGTSTSVKNQAFSTPPPLAYMVSELAGVTKETTVYEPTAGNGMLLIGADPKKATVNELEEQRASNLEENGFKVTSNDATTYAPQKEHDVEVMNPPFGKLGKGNDAKVDGYKIKEIDHLIAAKALTRLKDDGQATIIIGASKEPNTRKANDKIFFNWLYSHYNVTSHFEVNGKLYTRQGASWPVAVITVKGRNENKNILPVKENEIKRLDSWEQIYGHVNEVVDSSKRIGQDFSGTISGQNLETSQDTGSKNVPDGTGSTNTGSTRQGKGSSTTGSSTNSTKGSSRSTGGRGNKSNEPDKLGAGKEKQTNTSTGNTTEPNRKNADTGSDRKSVKLDELQVPYKSHSGGFNENVFIPTGLAEATEQALTDLEKRVGPLDKFVKSELGYESDEALYDAYMGLQIDAIALTIDNIKNGKGTIIADQTGVGKGREAAAIIRWALKNGKTPVFMSEKQNLFTDIYDDLADIGSNDVRPFIVNEKAVIEQGEQELYKNKNKKQYDKTISSGQLPEGINSVFLTYSQIRNAGNKKQDFLLNFANPNTVLILDESHNAGGDSATGDFMHGMLSDVGGALYLSATYAKRPDNVPIYYKTDLGRATESKDDLVSSIESGGVLMQTVISNQLAQSGQLIRRERSFKGIKINNTTLGGDSKEATQEQEQKADEITTTLRSITVADKFFHGTFVRLLKKRVGKGENASYTAGSEITSTNVQSVASGVDHSTFNSVVHNKIKQMLFIMKADGAADTAIQALKEGRKPVLAVDGTAETFMKEYAEENGIRVGDSIDSLSFKDVLTEALNNSRHILVKLPTGEKKAVEIPLNELDPVTARKYADAQRVIDALDVTELPVSPIDHIKNKIRQAGYSIKEITGRSHGIDYNDNTLVKIEEAGQNNRRTSVDEFNNDKVNALIMNSAGATGLSLHSSEKFKNQNQREMIVVQPSLDINTFMQMLGRVNRTGQMNKPVFNLLALNIPAEIRPNSILSKKMKSLNAQTSSDTKSSTSVESVDIMNKYGDEVVAEYLMENPALQERLSINLDDPKIIQTTTGRLALLPVKNQREFYDNIQSIYKSYIQQLDTMGRNDLEKKVVDLKAKELSTEVLYPGKYPGELFGGNADIGQFEVEKQGYPLTTNEVVDKITDFSKGKSSLEIKKDILSKTDDMSRIHVRSLKAQDEKHGDTNLVDHFRLSLSTYERGLDIFEVGERVNLKVNGEDMQGVVTGIKNNHKKGAAGSPFSLSKTNVRFAVNNAYSQITLPLSKLMGDNSAFSSKIYNKSIADIFDKAANNSAIENRFIVTGNLLQGLSKVSGGNIVQFTKNDNTTDVGILLPANFTHDAATGDWPVHSVDDVMTMLDAGETLSLSLKDSNIKKTSNGELSIQAGKSKTRAKDLIKDETLRGLTATNEFAKVGGGQWIARILASNNRKAVERLMEMYPFNVERKTAEKYGFAEKTKSEFIQETETQSNPAPGPTTNEPKLGEATLVEDEHTKTHEKMWLVETPYSPSKYKEMQQLAKKFGDGYWNHNKKKFHFKGGKQDAQDFADAFNKSDIRYSKVDKPAPVQHSDFSFTGVSKPSGLSVNDVFKIINDTYGEPINGASKFTNLNIINDKNQKWRGKFNPKSQQITLNAYYITKKDAVRILHHEKIHEFIKNDEKLKKIGDKILARAKKYPNSAAGKALEIAKRRVHKNASQYETRIYEETLAYLIQYYNKPGVKGVLKNLIEGIRKFFSDKYGIFMNESDAVNYVSDMVKTEANQYEDVATLNSMMNYIESTKDDEYSLLGGKAEPKPRTGIKRKVNPDERKVKLSTKWDNIKQGFFEKLRTQLVDRFNQLLVNDKKRRGSDVLNNQKTFSLSSWILAKASSAAEGAVHSMLDYGRIKLDKQRAIDRVVGSDKGIIKVLEQLGDSETINEFMIWIAANRAEKLYMEGYVDEKTSGPIEDYTKGRENLFTWEEIQEGKGFNKGREKLFTKVHNEFDEFRKDVLKIATKSGIISREQAAEFSKEFYVPFYRVMDESDINNGAIYRGNDGGIAKQNAYKKLRGGEQKVGDLLENTLVNYSHLISASLKNNASTMALLNASHRSVGVATKVPAKLAKKDKSVFVRKNGRKVFYNIDDPMTYNALVALADTGMNNGLMKTMRWFKRMFTASVTASPQFITANFMRDSVHAAAIGKKTLKNNAISGFLNFNDKNIVKQRMIASGGAFSLGHIFMDDPDSILRTIDKKMEGSKIISGPGDVKDVMLALWDKYQSISNRSENANRMAIYEQAIKDGKTHAQAAYEARDLLDFSSKGESIAIRILIDVVPFLNARLQGLDVVMRKGVAPSIKTIMGKGTDSDKVITTRFLMVMGAVSLASMMLYMAYKDDEDFKQLEDWQRDTYWFFKIGDHKFFIPKPFEIGAVGTMSERLLEQMVDDKVTGKVFAERFNEMLLTTFSFNPIPQMVKPINDVYANKDSFTGRQIETQSMQNMSPERRIRHNTTSLAKGVSTGMNEALDVVGADGFSPVQIDYLIRNYLGWVGASLSGAADNIINYGERPEQKWHEYQPFKRFYKQGDSNYSKYTTQFYENMKEVNRVYADIRDLRRTQQYAKAEKLRVDNLPALLKRKAMNRTSKKITRINKMILNVRNSGLSQAEKRRRIDFYQQKKILLTSHFKD